MKLLKNPCLPKIGYPFGLRSSENKTGASNLWLFPRSETIKSTT